MQTINGTKIKDMVSIDSLMEKFGMLSVNQLNAQVKLAEIWKALHVDDYPLQIKQQISESTRVNTRADKIGKPIEIGRSNVTQKTCVSDAIRLWNMTPDQVKNGEKLSLAKKEINKFVRQLPT